MNLAVKAVALALVLALAGCRGEPAAPVATGVETVLVVLGNEPLDDSTPTVDTIARVEKAVQYLNRYPESVLIFTGGPTAGTNTEARMMVDLALNLGVATNAIILEEAARSTRENALFTAKLVRRLSPQRILIVSKGDHLEWALPIFRKEEAFKAAESLACEVSAADSIAQMEAYMGQHPDNRRVRERLQALKSGRKGTD
jgi:uncharacterized SAM-binding protein YcdF (DUF218 family)